jgi:hypothetical protein
VSVSKSYNEKTLTSLAGAGASVGALSRARQPPALRPPRDRRRVSRPKRGAFATRNDPGGAGVLDAGAHVAAPKEQAVVERHRGETRAAARRGEQAHRFHRPRADREPPAMDPQDARVRPGTVGQVDIGHGRTAAATGLAEGGVGEGRVRRGVHAAGRTGHAPQRAQGAGHPTRIRHRTPPRSRRAGCTPRGRARPPPRRPRPRAASRRAGSGRRPRAAAGAG